MSNDLLAHVCAKWLRSPTLKNNNSGKIKLHDFLNRRALRMRHGQVEIKLQIEYRINIRKPMETGGGEPQKRLAKMKKRCFLIPADYNNLMSIDRMSVFAVWRQRVFPARRGEVITVFINADFLKERQWPRWRLFSQRGFMTDEIEVSRNNISFELAPPLMDDSTEIWYYHWEDEKGMCMESV